MNKATLLTIVIPVMLATQACNRSSSHDDDMVDIDSSASALNDTAPKLNIAVEKGDAQFIVDAAGSGMEEVALGKLAQQKATDLRIKNFGKMMAANHSKLTDGIKVLAATKKIAIPIAPDTDEQKAIIELSKKTGGEFDKAYIKNMIANHEKDISTFDAASKNCQDPEIKAFAKKMLPVLQTHLDAINTIKESMD
ncbi:MAG: DUF4142 domain-containing protein [Bacteroidota bacterium]|nr:DUF4142 domain-containing protein [Bacteroidota bacterium]